MVDPLEKLALSESEITSPLAAEPLGAAEVEAEFALETPVACPSCSAVIDSIGIVRLLRTRVNFVSSLPRRGHLMICPRCKTVLSGSLGGLV